MRVLVASIPETSHVFPIVPTALALRDRGHEVLAVAQPNVAPALAAAGLDVTTIGKAFDSVGFFAARLPAGLMPVEAWPLDLDLMNAMAARTWGNWGRDILAPQLEVARDWRPDLILCDPMETAARITGGVLGVPVVEHRWGPDSTGVFRAESARRMASLARKHGLDQLPAPTLTLDPCPPAMRWPDAEPGRPVRFIPYNGSGTAPDLVPVAAGLRRVCVCFGRFTGALTEGRLMRWTLEALAGIDGLEVLLAVSPRELDGIGQVAANVAILQNAPLSTFLDQCDLIVHHGGDGTGMTAMWAGVPQVVIPQLALQDNYGRLAERCGAARNLPELAQQRDPAVIAAAVRDVLEDPRYQAAARRVRAEIESMPPLPVVAEDLERLGSVAA